MKIQSLEIIDYPPIKNLKIENLGSVVIIAGANGSGKTRLKEAIVGTLQGNPAINLTIQATREDEKKDFLAETIEVKRNQQNQILNSYISSRRFGRGRYVGSLVQIDSQRNIQTTKYNPVSWLIADPDDQDTPSNFYYQGFTGRWQSFMDYIHQKVAAYQNNLAKEVIEGSDITAASIKEKFPHPLEKYKAIFKQLLNDKELQDISPVSPSEFKYKDGNGSILPFASLSSGEQEVVKVIFDVARKDIKHSVIIVDEPELHLHPTLTFKLVETLKAIGDHTNQYIFLTHSADLISTYYSTGDVYFIDSVQTGTNQAHKLSELNHGHKTLIKLIGENLGLFAVGKRLIFVEGENSSIDRLTYHTIAQKYLPEAKIIPVGSVENINNLNSVEEQIRNSIFGIDFYMIRDRDGLNDTQIETLEANGKIKCLKKKHIENYFLDSGILFKVAERLCLNTINPQLSQAFIESETKRIATDLLKLNLLQNTKEKLKLNNNFDIPTVKSLEEKDIELIKSEMITAVVGSVSKLATDLTQANLQTFMNEEKIKLENFLSTDDWRDKFQGKEIFSKLCNEVMKDDPLKIRQAYVDIALQEKPEIFQDIIDFFGSFKA